MSPSYQVTPPSSEHVTLTLSKSGNGYQVEVDRWEVKVHRDAAHGPQAIDWELDLGPGLVLKKFEIDFHGNQHFKKVTSAAGAGGKHTGKTGKIKEDEPKGPFTYDVTFHFTDGSKNVKIVLDPDYIVED